jgi:hypothetical protein
VIGRGNHRPELGGSHRLQDDLGPCQQFLSLKGVSLDLNGVGVVQFVLFGVDDLHQGLPYKAPARQATMSR